MLLAVPAMASRIVEDSRSKFVLDDEVVRSQVSKCDDPERSFVDDDNGVPYRSYRVALPSKNRPSVSLSGESLLPLGNSLQDTSSCEKGDFGRAPLRFTSVSVSDPYFKDGLWVADIRVPLYVKSGNSVALRKNYRVNVQFEKASQGVNPGKRALSSVINTSGAEKFGVSMNAARKAIRKASADQTADVSFLAQLLVTGDKNRPGSPSEDGLYAVDFKTIRTSLLSLGRQNDLDGIPVDQLCLYGASPDTISSFGPGAEGRNPNQIFEIPIEVRDHSPNGNGPDGTFNEGDSIVFIGYGNGFWKRADREDPSYVNGSMDYFHSYSPYSTYQSFLFGVKESGKGKRLSEVLPAVNGTGKDVDWMRYVRAEKDAILRDTYFGKDLDWESSTGKEWFWAWGEVSDTVEVSSSTLYTRETSSLPGLIAGGKNYVAVSYFPNRSVWDNTAYAGQKITSNLSGKTYAERMDEIWFVMDVNGTKATMDSLKKENMVLMPGGNFRMENAALKAEGNQYALTMLPSRRFQRFDGYSVAYQWTPVVDSAEWLLPGAVSGVINVPVPAGTQVMKFVDLQPVGLLNASSGMAKDSVNAAEDVRYLAVKKDVFRTSLKVSGIPSKRDGVISNLSRPNSNIEYLIITPTEFLAGADSIAEFRSSGKASSVIPTGIVTVEDIYRKYTAGRVSPGAIRNYIAYAREVCPNLNYVLLVGSGHFDYRGMNAKLGPIYIPPYEIEDKAVDDFYAVLDSGEQVMYGVYDLDVSLARLPVSSNEEVLNYYRKAKDYEMSGTMDFSNWRSVLLISADDGKNSGSVDKSKHTLTTESLNAVIDSASLKHGIRWNFKKVYLIDYEEDAAAQKKDAAEDFMNVLNQGALFTSYFGHGSMTDWASEGLMKVGYVTRLNNKGRNTILGSFSCTVGRFDFGVKKSLSEAFVLAKDVGAIASVGATRETWASSNRRFAEAYMLGGLVEGRSRLGDAFRYGKKAGSGKTSYNSDRYNEERYTLFGEPVVPLPNFTGLVHLDRELDTLRALDKVTLSGSVDNIQDGYVDLMITEGRFSRRVSLQVDDDSITIFNEGNLIFSEEVAVKNGRFETQFITPKKLSFGDSLTEIRMWAFDNKKSDVAKYLHRDMRIEGVSSYADSLKDTVPPTITIQPCYAGANAGFTNGEIVKLQTPACLQVVVEDSTALDFREQADEGISFEIAGVKDPFHPWPYLEQTSKMAKIRMNFAENLYPAGNYIFKVRALDVLGNRSVKMVYLDITDDLTAGLQNVYNVPNPMGKKGTTFYFKDLAVGKDAKIDIFIYNQNGKLVKVIKNAVSGVTHWDGRDNHGRLLANGLYHYVVRSQVSSGNDKKTFTKKQKLLISR
ncbi:Peptidase family C25 [Fibrobacter sp. UWEL]|nr:Peptidase family C25 [Fibrobacter sp. UWEL]